MCRVFLHAWNYVDVQRDGRVFIQSLSCIRCGTMKFIRINSSTGAAITAWYQHPEGYLFAEGGHMTPDERAATRLNEVKTNLKGQE